MISTLLTMPRKTEYQLGLETILNNPKTSFLHNPATFNEIHSQSGMSYNQMIRFVGKGAKNKKGKEPTDAEKGEARLKELDAKQK